jgi:hypothetical protein
MDIEVGLDVVGIGLIYISSRLVGGIPPSREDHLCRGIGRRRMLSKSLMSHWEQPQLPYAMLCSWCRVFVMVLATFYIYCLYVGAGGTQTFVWVL